MTTTTQTTRETGFALASLNSAGSHHLGEVRQHLAEAMIGKTVDILNGRAVKHGIVKGVLLLAGHPKLLVNGRMYDMDQILTVTPA